jgi:hypothetical protein
VPRRILACLTAVAAAGTALLTAGHAAAATTTPPTTCSGTVWIGGLAFDPPHVAPGGSSTAALTAANCTGATQTVSETWSGSWLSSSATGIPTGCPAIDPLPRTVTLAPYQKVATATTYLVFPGCTADALRLTVRVSQGGTVLATRTADLVIDRPTTT